MIQSNSNLDKKDAFRFDLNAKRTRISDKDLLESLTEYATNINFRFFTTTEYDKWEMKVAGSDTISSRFGSWRKALKIIGIEGGREREYSPKELIDNLEKVWKELGYPPSKRQISRLGLKISERPYIRIWGSVRNACVCIEKYHSGKISKDRLMSGDKNNCRITIPLTIRWKVLKRDNYRCQRCGQSPTTNPKVELEIDHILPVSRGGTNDISNLQTLCKRCNQGKKDAL
jgi:5-methylcytosine-specific restriction endonuclease McrA